MKKLSLSLAVFFFLVLSFTNTGNAQTDSLFHVEVESCSSAGGCEVVVRQYTGIVNFYSINVRCMDSSGNFGSWQNWTYNGIYPGGACNGEI